MYHKYQIPKSSIYKMIRDDKQGKIMKFKNSIVTDNNILLTNEEKELIKSCVIPPKSPITINKVNIILKDEFGIKNRKRQI